jgi:ankyrin repeat protein
MDVDENQANEPRSPNTFTSEQAQTRDFDPELAGFGKFFTYAACYWTEHFKQCSPDALPNVCDISKLARRGSLTLRNWMETYKRPSLTSSPQRNLNVEEFDELVVAAHFGSHAFLAKFLERRFEDNCIRDESSAKAVKWAMQSGDLTAVKIMLQNKSLGKRLRSGLFLCEIMTIWKYTTSTEKAIVDKWKELLEILVCEFLNDGASSYDWANTILCSAARQGCLPVIEILFEKASGEPELAKALLAETQNDTVYQSVGEAAFWGQANVIQYLLTQDYVDISPHLHHRTISKNPSIGPSGRNVLHCAANSRNPDIFRILVKKFPSGVNEQTESGDTPLHILVFARPTSVEAVRVLVEIGRADVNLSPGGEWYSPLRTAIRAKNVEVCQLLASCGAHVDDAIEVDALSGRLILKDSLEDAETSECILKELALASQSEACKRYLRILKD